MSYSLLVQPAASQDVADVADRYDQQRPGLGDEFTAAANAVFATITVLPKASAPFDGEFRGALVARFPYQVIYRLRRDIVEVIAVAHTSRGVQTWRSRLP